MEESAGQTRARSEVKSILLAEGEEVLDEVVVAGAVEEAGAAAAGAVPASGATFGVAPAGAAGATGAGVFARTC